MLKIGGKGGCSMHYPLFIAVALLTAQDTYAYLDPGTGSMILQVVVGTIVGAFMAIKLYWSRLREFFRKMIKK